MTDFLGKAAKDLVNAWVFRALQAWGVKVLRSIQQDYEPEICFNWLQFKENPSTLPAF
jgi:hypothetical protein